MSERSRRIEASARVLVVAWEAIVLDPDTLEGLLMDLRDSLAAPVEALKREIDDWKSAAIAQANLSVERLNRVQELEAALRTILAAHGHSLMMGPVVCDCDICEHCRAALSAQPAATGEGT